ncbi:MAG: carboxypeptidase-like regulatory domain-containing protein [Bacteroidia bacterium]|nr:carboxypeptidase-like regulatory domain-containing protein [Bacteroidia bacterium]
MKKYIIINLLSLLFCVLPLLGNENDVLQAQPYTLRGRVLASDTRNPLPNASVTVGNLNVSSVTNQEGYFMLRVPASARNSKLIIRYLGYENMEIPVITFIDKPNNHIMLIPSSIQLGAIEVVSGDGRELMREALSRISQNYSIHPNTMVAFYRESIKKNANYISLVEAVLDVYKSSYRSYENDQAKIYIGRKATDISPRDTVLMKFQGGISTALMLDVAKNPEIVFGEQGDDYIFNIERMININNKPHYEINFLPQDGVKEIVFRGKVYLDAASLAIARMEFNMNVEGRKDAANIFIRRKPAKMKVDIEEACYVADYIENNGKWFFNYSSIEVKFKVRWTNRFFGLFATNYTIGSEMAITDRYQESVNKFPRNERIRSTDVIAEKVEYFQDPEFWGEYNVIEPDQKINAAIKRLSGKLIRRTDK